MTFTGFLLPVATLREIATATADRRNQIPQNAALVCSWVQDVLKSIFDLVHGLACVKAEFKRRTTPLQIEPNSSSVELHSSHCTRLKAYTQRVKQSEKTPRRKPGWSGSLMLQGELHIIGAAALDGSCISHAVDAHCATRVES